MNVSAPFGQTSRKIGGCYFICHETREKYKNKNYDQVFSFFGQLQLRPFFEHADSHQNLDLSRLEDAVRVSRESVL